MNNVFKTAILSVGTLALGACSFVNGFSEIDTLNEIQPVGSPFTQSLVEEYRQFSNYKLEDQLDYPDALHFARKGIAAAKGEAVLPEPVMDWNLEEMHAQELSAARGRLIVAYDLGAREIAPALAARVQAKYDCWIEYQEENWKGETASICQNEFSSLLNELEAMLPAPQVQEVAQMPAPAFDSNVFDIDPAEPMAAENAMYLVFFNWDSSKLSTGATSVLDAVSDEVSTNTPNSVNVIGHADTSGPTDYNERLAIRRAKAVKTYLTNSGVDASMISMDARGEGELLVPTPDNVREPANRRVNISFN